MDVNSALKTELERQDLASFLQTREPDLWAASRLVSEDAARLDLEAVFCLEHQWRHVGQRTANPLMAQIRLAWWREQIVAVAAGRSPGDHPALTRLAPRLIAGALDADRLDSALEACQDAFEDHPLEDETALLRHVASLAKVRVAAGLMLDLKADAEALHRSAKVAVIGRLIPLANAYWIPRSWRDAGEAAARSRLTLLLKQAIRAARTGPRVSEKAFPAIAESTLYTGKDQGPVVNRAKLLWASVRGRI